MIGNEYSPCPKCGAEKEPYYAINFDDTSFLRCKRCFYRITIGFPIEELDRPTLWSGELASWVIRRDWDGWEPIRGNNT